MVSLHLPLVSSKAPFLRNYFRRSGSATVRRSRPQSEISHDCIFSDVSNGLFMKGVETLSLSGGPSLPDGGATVTCGSHDCSRLEPPYSGPPPVQWPPLAGGPPPHEPPPGGCPQDRWPRHPASGMSMRTGENQQNRGSQLRHHGLYDGPQCMTPPRPPPPPTIPVVPLRRPALASLPLSLPLALQPLQPMASAS